MVRIALMAKHFSGSDRRNLLKGLSALVIVPILARNAFGQQPSLTLRAGRETVGLRPGQANTPFWALNPATSPLRFKRGGTLEIEFKNELPRPAVLNWYGLDGIAAIEPLAALAPVQPGATARFTLPLRQAGTFCCDLRLVEVANSLPSRPLAFVVEESAPVTADSDEVLLIEDWRLEADGTALLPGSDPGDAATPIYAVNGRILPEISVQTHQRLRFRFISGFQRQVIALKVENHDVRVMAMDSQPAEPFPARNGALVLAPGGRVDVLIDATNPPGSSSLILLHDGKEARPVARLVTSTEPPVRPAPLPVAPALPSNGQPALLDLKGAVRVNLALSGPEWVPAARFGTGLPPAFRAAPGRTVVLALVNRGDAATVFRLHGHHFRLLDRLDDGWKPFWLDTLAVESGQTQRVAFAADFAGRWLIESTGTAWTAPRLLQWYAVN